MPFTVTHARTHLRFSRHETERILRRVLRGEGTGVSSVGVVFINHAATIALNARYLGKRRTTDVIAFCYEREPVIEGEIFINLDQARAQSTQYGVSFREEVSRLLIHGMLHLIGYDDSSAGQRRRMRTKEDYYLGRGKRPA